jgi:predicted N-acetyltransferase YhbS
LPLEVYAIVSVRPMTVDDLEQVAELLQAAFPDIPLDHAEAIGTWWHEPGFRPGEAWVAEEAGCVVGHVATMRTWMALCGHRVPTLHIGSVCVSPSRQGSGIGSLMMREAHSQVAGDAELTFLTPAHDPSLDAFYMRLGYVHVLRQEPRVRVGLGDIWSPGPPGRPAGEKDVEDIKRLYEETYLSINGFFGRTADMWRRRIALQPRLWVFHQAAFFVAHSGNQISAYCARTVGDAGLRVIEWAAEPERYEDAFAVLMAACASSGERSAVVAIGPEHPMYDLLVPGSGTVLAPEEDWSMLAVLKPEAVAQRVHLWARDRILNGWHLELGPEGLRIAGSQGSLSCGLVGAAALFYNGASVSRLEAEGALTLDGDLDRLLSSVFPQRFAGRSPLDCI